MKLLVIDSDRDLVEMLTSWLKTLGHEVYLLILANVRNTYGWNNNLNSLFWIPPSRMSTPSQ